jgi:hypothetical protein
VTGRQRIRAQVPRSGQQIGELDRLVAGNAGDRRFAGHIAFGKRVDHRFLEALFVVENIVRNAERFADAPGIINVLAGAAGPCTVHRGAMVIELQRHAQHIIALAGEKPRHDGAVDAARHGDHHPRVTRVLIKSRLFTVFPGIQQRSRR